MTDDLTTGAKTEVKEAIALLERRLEKLKKPFWGRYILDYEIEEIQAIKLLIKEIKAHEVQG